MDKRADLLKKLQAELDRRTRIENEVVHLIENCEFEKAQELLGSLDDSIVKEMEKELSELSVERGEGKESDKEMTTGDNMSELSERDKLYNAIMEAVKEHGTGMEIGLVRAVLAEVDGEIALKTNRVNFDTVCGMLRER